MKLRCVCILLGGICLPLTARAQTGEPVHTPMPPEAVESRAGAADEQTDHRKAEQEVRSAADAVKEAAGGQNEFTFSTDNGTKLFSVAGLMQQATEKAAWIGLSVSPAPPALRHQLRLPEGTGLVVDFVQPKSPGEQGGIKQYDLLEKLDDQILINPDQFAVLVRTYKPGDQVKLTLLREGKQDAISVKLIQRELTPLPEPLIQFKAFPADSPPMAMTSPRVAPVPAPPHWQKGSISPDEKSFTWVDGDHLLVITTRDGHSVVSARDARTGKQLYTGPLDTKEQREKLSEEVREALDKANFWYQHGPAKPDSEQPTPPASREQ